MTDRCGLSPAFVHGDASVGTIRYSDQWVADTGRRLCTRCVSEHQQADNSRIEVPPQEGRTRDLSSRNFIHAVPAEPDVGCPGLYQRRAHRLQGGESSQRLAYSQRWRREPFLW